MTLRLRRLAFLVSTLVAATALTATAQRAAVSTGPHDAPLTQTVPVDPQITVGTLPNGLRYYVRANKRPLGRAELRLAVNVGSILEDDDQRGLAHFVEHMAFNGTRHFPKQDVVAFLQSTGMRFGAHINANTSFDQTIYQLTIPTDDPAVIDRSLLIMEDWAHDVTFDPEEIDKERGVILEEWRQGLGAGQRMLDAQFPIMLQGSRYADRLPIGKPEILRSFKRERLTKFYSDWYRPDLMAVIAVGDFDPAAVEALIKKHFASIPAAPPKTRPLSELPDHPGTRYAIATDPEATATTVSVFSTFAARDQTTIGGYRQMTVDRIFSSLLSSRLAEIAQKPGAPFLAATTGRGGFVRSTEATSLSALVAEDGVEKGLTALFTEANRVAQFGFTATELDRYRLAYGRSFEQLASSKDEHTSVSLADEFVRNFTQDEPIPGIAYENGLVKRFLPEITLEEINALAREWMPDRNRAVVVSAPKRDGRPVPTETQLAAAIKSASGGGLTAYVDAVSAKPLLEPLPTPGRVSNTSTKAAAGITEWTLANGVRVVLKPTTLKQDEIVFRAFSPGGTSLADDKSFIPAETASDVVGQGGLGALTNVDLGKKLAGKAAFVRADIGESYEGLSGRALSRDVETMFQLIYLTFTQPRADQAAFRALIEQMTAALSNRQALPETAFTDTLNGVLTQDHPRAKPLSTELVAQMNLDQSLAFYKERFADASDFTFVFVGSFDLATFKPLVERYLASLPALHRKEAPRDVGIRPPTGIVEKEVTKGREPKSQVGVVFTGPFRNSPQQRLIVRAVADTLEGNLQRVLREDLGGTYGVSVEPGFTQRPDEEYRLTISFACDPARTADLVKALWSVVDDFRANGPSEGQLSDVRAALLRDLETNRQSNGYWLNLIGYAYQYNEELFDDAKLRALYEGLTPSALRDAARTYLDTKRYVKVVLMPESK